MYEPRDQPPIPHAHFVWRILSHSALALGLVLASLVLGMGGYMYYEDLAWRDAFLNAAMLLGGMGPVDAPRSDAGKLFAGLYALYAGFVLLVGASMIVAPIAHRILHKFHWEDEKD